MKGSGLIGSRNSMKSSSREFLPGTPTARWITAWESPTRPRPAGAARCQARGLEPPGRGARSAGRLPGAAAWTSPAGVRVFRDRGATWQNNKQAKNHHERATEKLFSCGSSSGSLRGESRHLGKMKKMSPEEFKPSWKSHS
ncbi:uncharacterized protein LOC144282263 [Canis aureus]